MLVDFLFRTQEYYHTSTTENDAEVTPDVLFVFLPYSALLRPIWILSRYTTVRRTLKNFMATLRRAKDVFLLFAIMVIIGSIMGVLLLSGRIQDDGDTQDFNTFDNLFSGLLTLFVLFVSAENKGR